MTATRDKKTQLIIECGVVQTRSALVDNGEVTRLWIGPALGDEGLDQTPFAGHHFFGRVTSINASLNAAFVDLGDGGEGFLPLNKKLAALLSEGIAIRVEIKSPPRQGKGGVVSFVSADASNDDSLGKCPPFDSPVVDAITEIGAVAGEIVIDHGGAVSSLRSRSLDIEISHYTDTVPLFTAFGVESVFEAVFERFVDLVGGGRLVIDEAQALTAIDVDTAGLSASSSERLREKIAIAAAHESVRQIRLRQIGGHVVVDFPRLKSDTSRKRFTELLRKTMSQIEGAGAFSFSKSGLFSMTVPHRNLSFSEQFTEIDSQYPIPGRCFTLDWQAKMAINRLENRLQASPASRIQLCLSEALFNYIQTKDSWIDRLEERYSVRFELVLDNKRMTSHFEISEQ